MENEIMNVVEETVNPEVITEVYAENKGGIGLGMVIGGACVAAGIAVYKFGRKLVQDHKAKKKATVKIEEEVDVANDKIDEIPGVE